MKYHALYDSLYKRKAMSIQQALVQQIKDRTSERNGAMEEVRSRQEEIIALVVLIAAALPEAKQREVAHSYGLKEVEAR